MIAVVANDEDTRLGFKPSAMPPDRIFVEEVEAGSWSDVRGICKGDELIACNGEAVLQITPKALVNIMKARPLRLTFSRILPAGRAARRLGTAPAKLASSGETAAPSTMPDTESSVSYMESYEYTPSDGPSSAKSKISPALQPGSVSPAWPGPNTAAHRTVTTTPSALLEVSSASSTPGAKSLSDSLRAALFDEDSVAMLNEQIEASQPDRKRSEIKVDKEEMELAEAPAEVSKLEESTTEPRTEKSNSASWAGAALDLTLQASGQDAKHVQDADDVANVGEAVAEQATPTPLESPQEDDEDMSF